MCKLRIKYIAVIVFLLEPESSLVDAIPGVVFKIKHNFAKLLSSTSS